MTERRPLDVWSRSPVKLIYEPRPREKIGRIEIELAGDGIYHTGEYKYDDQTEASLSFRKQCGNRACYADVTISTIGTSDNDGSTKIWSSSVTCYADDCPLGESGGGGAYDREPRNPLPPLPEISAKQSPLLEVQS